MAIIIIFITFAAPPLRPHVQGTPLLVTVASFSIFSVLPGNHITASKAFTALSLFNLMRFPLNGIPSSINR